MSSNKNALQSPWPWVGLGMVLFLLAAVAVPNLLRSRFASDESSRLARNRAELAALRRAALQSGGNDSSGATSAIQDRKLVRISALELLVRAPGNTADQIIQLAQNAGGYVVTSQTAAGETAASASLTLRVPAIKFDELRAQIRKLGLRVENETVETQDVTKQYVDHEARLRNLRAEEQQYLGILRQAANVKDTLEVSDKLNEVRGAVEERQAELEALSKQVEAVAINVTLRAEADAQVFGLNWRPLYQVKIAAREGLSGLADYAASMTAFVFYLPTALLWLLTILAGAALPGESYAGRRKFSLDIRRSFASSRPEAFTRAYVSGFLTLQGEHLSSFITISRVRRHIHQTRPMRQLS